MVDGMEALMILVFFFFNVAEVSIVHMMILVEISKAISCQSDCNIFHPKTCIQRKSYCFGFEPPF